MVKALYTTTRELDSFSLKICFGEFMSQFPGNGFITCVLSTNAPSPRNTYGIFVSELCKGCGLGKFKELENILSHNTLFLCLDLF